MTLKIEVGKSYRTAGGWRADVVEDDGSNYKPLYVYHSHMVGEYLWHNRNGTADADGCDLIAAWPEGPGLSPHPEADDAPAVDLTAITTPFGLLDEATQEALKAWPHGHELFYSRGSWGDVLPGWNPSMTYRAKPAPKVTEHVLYWEARRANAFHTLRDGDTHRITLRHTGDTLPSGKYTGPDGATITVEVLE